MMPHCDLCAAHRVQIAGPYYRQMGDWMKNLCAFHERARQRLVLFRKREARALAPEARIIKATPTIASVHGVH